MSTPVNINAWHAGGRMIHADRDCVPKRGTSITVAGPMLPPDHLGQIRRWHPCRKCGAPLLLELAHRSTSPAVPVLITARRLPTDLDEAWAVTSTELAIRMLRQVADQLGWVNVADEHAEDITAITLRYAATVPVDVVQSIRVWTAAVPLPTHALALAQRDVAAFAPTAAVYARLVDGIDPDTIPSWDEPGGMAAWARTWWDTASAVLAPAGQVAS